MKGGFEPATLQSQVEHSTTEPKPLLICIQVISNTYSVSILSVESTLFSDKETVLSVSSEEFVTNWFADKV